MPIYLYWGEDDFEIAVAVKQLQQEVIDPNWIQFNYHQLSGDRQETILEGLNLIMTPGFGMGGRLVWLVNTTICQQCPENILTELQRTVPAIPDNAHLLLTTSKKIDNRLKSTKLIKQYAQIKEFNLIPPWETEAIVQKVQEIAQQKQVKLTNRALELLAESVGSNTRQITNELKKLSLYYSDQTQIIDADVVANLVVCNTQTSLQIAKEIIAGKAEIALGLITDLINLNEPPLKIVATLVGQFRTWLIIKLMEETGNKDFKAIAETAEIGNPYRVKHLQKEIASLSSKQLLASLPLLLKLEYSLKRGAEPLATLQTKIIELCNLFKRMSDLK